MNENNNITLEQVEKLRAHANVSYEDARAALEATGGDMLEAIIRLEKEGKTRSHTASHSTLNPVPMQSNSSGWQYGQGHQGPSEFSRQMRRLWNGFCRLVRKGNENDFEFWRDGRCAINFPVTLLVVFLIFFFWVTVPLMVVGLFFGCTYRFTGPDLDGSGAASGVNKAMDTAAQTAEDIKKAVSEDKNNDA